MLKVEHKHQLLYVPQPALCNTLEDELMSMAFSVSAIISEVSIVDVHVIRQVPS